jgi:hypothetical protein
MPPASSACSLASHRRLPGTLFGTPAFGARSEVVAKHLLALRWMNPNAVVYLREVKGQGTPTIEYELRECSARRFSPSSDLGGRQGTVNRRAGTRRAHSVR